MTDRYSSWTTSVGLVLWYIFPLQDPVSLRIQVCPKKGITPYIPILGGVWILWVCLSFKRKLHHYFVAAGWDVLIHETATTFERHNAIFENTEDQPNLRSEMEKIWHVKSLGFPRPLNISSSLLNFSQVKVGRGITYFGSQAFAKESGYIWIFKVLDHCIAWMLLLKQLPAHQIMSPGSHRPLKK